LERPIDYRKDEKARPRLRIEHPKIVNVDKNYCDGDQPKNNQRSSDNFFHVSSSVCGL
jgi:hypothetical protein